MDKNLNVKLNTLREILQKVGKIVIAFSGGVDSTLLLKVARNILSEKNVLAVTLKSPLIPQSEINDSTKLAQLIGAKQIIIDVTKNLFDDENIRHNKDDRCYFCKKTNFTKIVNLAKKLNFSSFADGSNLDDIRDYRPGFKALKELGVLSPLIDAKLRKEEIRQLSRYLNLPTYNKPALACFATRFPYNTTLTFELLKRVEDAETFIKQCGVKQLRVRDHKNLARIEVSEDNFYVIIKNREAIISKLRSMGYTYVTLDIEGYRSGKMNTDIGVVSEYQRNT